MPTARVGRTQSAYAREFDKKIIELNNLSERAATYLLHDPQVKSVYRENIRKAISYLTTEFYKKGDYSTEYRNERDNIYNGLIYLYEGEHAAYQRARRNDWSIYEMTAKFENSGFLFYSKETLQIVGGVVQVLGGLVTFQIGAKIKSRTFKGAGILTIFVGASNTFEHGSAIFYEVTKGEYGKLDHNFLNNIMVHISKQMGHCERTGELAYKTIDFSVGMFLSFGTLVKLNNPKRILNLPFESKSGLVYPGVIDRMTNPKGGFFLYNALQSDYVPRAYQMSRPALFYNAGMTGYKGLILFPEYNSQ